MIETLQPPLPYISVVVPAYNEEDTIGDCLDSLLKQDYPRDHYEVIVVNNNSKDGTADVVRKYPVTLLFESWPSSDAARNTGIRRALGDIIAFTDADCVADPRWLSQLVFPFTNTAVVGVAGRIVSLPDHSLVAQFEMARVSSPRPIDEDMVAAPTGNVAYRKQALLDIGLFDGSILGAGIGDIDLSWRIQVQTGGRIVRSLDAIIFHRCVTTVDGLFRQFRRAGYGEILLTTLHRGRPYHQRTPARHLVTILRQVRALLVYVLSTGYRFLTWPIQRRGRQYLLSPVLWFVADFGSVVGKIDGLVDTRFFRRNPALPNVPCLHREAIR